MMTAEKKLIEDISNIFNLEKRYVRHFAGGGNATLEGGSTFSMQTLDDLALLLGHTNINICYREEEQGYSDLTPGSSSQCKIVWHEDLAKLARD